MELQTAVLDDRPFNDAGVAREVAARRVWTITRFERLPGGIVEAFREGSFYSVPADANAPTVKNRIENAEIIDGLPFDTLENTLYYKRKNGREKDLKDILLIEQWMRMQFTLSGER